jgi:hypothetical protein
MKRKLFTATMVVTLCAAVAPAMAADESLCMDCHEPAEDWEGMSREEVLVQAKDPDVKRHKDNRALSDEQLQVIIVELLPE